MPLINDPNVIACTCRHNHDPHGMCDGVLRLDEKGIKVSLQPKANEQAQLLIFDDCYCTRNGVRKCDALYILQGTQHKYLIRVELKGTHIEDGVQQLAETQQLDEYVHIKQILSDTLPMGNVMEYAFLISSQPVGSADKKRLSRAYQLSFKTKTVAKGTGKVVDIRADI